MLGNPAVRVHRVSDVAALREPGQLAAAAQQIDAVEMPDFRLCALLGADHDLTDKASELECNYYK